MDTNKDELSIESERRRIFEAMVNMGIESKEYLAALRALKELEDVENQQKRRKPSPDTVLLVATNLLGILLILNYERLNVVSSRAISFILRKPA